MKNNKLKKWELSLLIALSISLLTATYASAQSLKLEESLIRLHVIAVSDEDYEQSLKLEVRDAVLAYLDGLLENAENSDAAEIIINENLENIKAAAETMSEGRSITVSLERESYPTREYETFTLPAGMYRSLKIEIGEAMGQNWWCVVFPPLCIDTVSSEIAVEAMSLEGLTILSEEDTGIEFRFKIVELWGELMAFIS